MFNSTSFEATYNKRSFKFMSRRIIVWKHKIKSQDYNTKMLLQEKLQVFWRKLVEESPWEKVSNACNYALLPECTSYWL